MTSLREWGARGSAALAAAVFLTLIASLFRIEPISPLILGGVLAIIPLAAIAPRTALLVVAGLTPFVAWIGRHWNGSVSWPETLVVAFCAGYCARRVVTRTVARDSLDAPWVLAIVLVLASLAVFYLIDSWRFGPQATRSGLWQLLTFGYFISSTTADPIDAGMRLLESLVLFRAAATLAREAPGYASRLVSWAVCGATAAAALNLLRVWESAARVGTAEAFFRLLLSERINVHYGDLNAAGSYFVMALFAAIGLMMRPRGLPWVVSVLLIGYSVWQTGSRAAVVAGMLAMLLPAGARVWRRRSSKLRGTTLAAAALFVALLAGVAAYAIPERGNQRSVGTAAHVRWELARTSLRMTASSPWFGVGLGRYYSRSGEFSSPELLASFPPAVHENAHNNFFQVLAELGIVGFAIVMWLLVTAAHYVRRLLAADAHDPLPWSVATGLVAFVLSWLAGHPLLIDEPAFAFWLLLGGLAGWGESLSPASGRDRIRGWVVPAAAVLVALSVPVRADRQKADFNLEHRGVGLSAWHDAIDGVRYRVAGTSSSVFLPADVQMVVVPLRAVGPPAEVRLELRLDGRPADVIMVSRERWHLLRLNLPQERNGTRFRRLDLHVLDVPANADNVLMIGKVQPK
jgi:O-antigen ligase